MIISKYGDRLCVTVTFNNFFAENPSVLVKVIKYFPVVSSLSQENTSKNLYSKTVNATKSWTLMSKERQRDSVTSVCA